MFKIGDIEKLKKNLEEIGDHARKELARDERGDLWVGLTIREIKHILEQQPQPEEEKPIDEKLDKILKEK